MRERYGRIYLVPAVLAFAGPGFLVVATRGKFLPFAIGWWILALGVASIRSRAKRVGVVSLVLIPICVLAAFEGGVDMLPALLALLLIDVFGGKESPSHPPGTPQPRSS